MLNKIDLIYSIARTNDSVVVTQKKCLNFKITWKHLILYLKFKSYNIIFILL
jgi:hypothetical protein